MQSAYAHSYKSFNIISGSSGESVSPIGIISIHCIRNKESVTIYRTPSSNNRIRRQAPPSQIMTDPSKQFMDYI